MAEAPKNVLLFSGHFFAEGGVSGNGEAGSETTAQKERERETPLPLSAQIGAHFSAPPPLPPLRGLVDIYRTAAAAAPCPSAQGERGNCTSEGKSHLGILHEIKCSILGHNVMADSSSLK